jgi:hypothetical protein
MFVLFIHFLRKKKVQSYHISFGGNIRQEKKITAKQQQTHKLSKPIFRQVKLVSKETCINIVRKSVTIACQ